MVALACWLAILAIPALVWRFAPGPVRLNLGLQSSGSPGICWPAPFCPPLLAASPGN